MLKAIGSARIGATIPGGFDEFLSDQPFVVVGAASDAVWATLLTGDPGFVRVLDDRSVAIDALPGPADPLSGHFDTEQDVGLLAIEPETRRRVHLNGRARASPAAGSCCGPTRPTGTATSTSSSGSSPRPATSGMRGTGRTREWF